MEGFAYLVAPIERRERQRWFPLAGWVPEALLGQAGRFIPWRMLVEFGPGADDPVPAPAGAVVGLAATAEGVRRWEAAKRRQHLIGLVEELAARGLRLFGFGRGFPWFPGVADPLREAVEAVYGGTAGGVVEEWAGRLVGSLAAAELVAAARNWDCERAEVVLVGGETPVGRVAARFFARRFGRLTLAGNSAPLTRLAGRILHETGTAARVTDRWPRVLERTDLVVLAAPLPAGAVETLRPETVVLELDAGVDGCRARVISGALFTWPAGRPSAGLPGAVWTPGEALDRPLVAADLAALAAVGAGAGADPATKGEEILRLVGSREPSLGGALALGEALKRGGFRPAAVLDKAGALLL
ncbi:MAG: hypothetical protein ACM3XZ_06035 [Betaproteobacteria bacterium]